MERSGGLNGPPLGIPIYRSRKGAIIIASPVALLLEKIFYPRSPEVLLGKHRLMENETLSWSALESPEAARSTDWYWAVWIIAISVAITAVLFGNILFGILIFLAALAVTLHSKNDTQVVRIELNPKGVLYHNKLYLYSALESFGIDEHRDSVKLILKSKKLFMPYIIIPIEEVHPQEIADYLGMFLKKEEHLEPLSHILMEYLGF